MSTPSRLQRLRIFVSALWWTVTGTMLGMGVVSILTIGVFVFLAGFLMALVGLKFFGREATPVFALVGFAAIPLLLAYLYRHGPGEYCWTNDNGRPECVELPWGPWGFLVAAMVIIVATPVIWRSVRR